MSFRDIHLYACNLVHNPSNGMMIDVKEFILSCLVQVKASVYMFFFLHLYANQSLGSWSLEIEGKIEKQRVI